jgi:peptidoglycan/LPS O-acetylase OafA/YrhL
MRNKRLDVLRCVAILLVLFHHGQTIALFSRAGWVGVDLFFVLSGFLISGLLFGEYRKTGGIQFKRFFIRRGFKIYPAFYFLVAGVALVELYRHALSPLARYLHEIFLIQSYYEGIWSYTWSLAVEEHFYIFLPLLLLTMVRFSANRQDPFRGIPAVFLVVAVACQLSRAISAVAAVPNVNLIYRATHNRMDSLFFGVLIGYWYHFRAGELAGLMRPGLRRRLVVAVSAVFLSSAYWFDRETWFFGMIGYALIYLGFGGILLASLYIHDVLPEPLAKVAGAVGAGFAAVGVYSYSIYLWHGMVNAYLLGLTKKLLQVPLGRYSTLALAVAEALGVGIFMSKLVEYPALHLRERLFPSRVMEPSYAAEAGIPENHAQEVAAS